MIRRTVSLYQWLHDTYICVVIVDGFIGQVLDTFARSPLWDVGLVYRHGTGHGIGMYLSVHEGITKTLLLCSNLIQGKFI